MVSTRSSATTTCKAFATPPRKSIKTNKTLKTPPTQRMPVATAKPVKQDTNEPGIRMIGDRRILFSLQDNEELVEAKLIVRPSKRNRSPYVADVWLEDEQREAIAHLPNLDMGGKCVPGVSLLLKPARDRKDVKVGHLAVSPKYGTPKCEFITQLMLVDEAAYSSALYPPTWVGAHPTLGERIAETWLRENLVEGMPEIVHVQTQVRNPCGTDNIRSDFCVTHTDGTKRIVEVKTVVDTDYAATAVPPPIDGISKKKKRCIFTSDKIPYTRTAIFPWGNSNQKGPDGEAVVSTRAIHHVRELTRIATGELKGENDETYQATVLLVVIRGDAEAFRPNHEACPSFCRYLKEAEQAGVQVIAKRVSWGTGKNEGVCFDDKVLPIEWPSSSI